MARRGVQRSPVRRARYSPSPPRRCVRPRRETRTSLMAGSSADAGGSSLGLDVVHDEGLVSATHSFDAMMETFDYPILNVGKLDCNARVMAKINPDETVLGSEG